MKCKKCRHFYRTMAAAGHGYNPASYCHIYEDTGKRPNVLTQECFEAHIKKEGEKGMNRYAELHQRQQQEVNALPMGFAFSDKQFREMMEGWGLDPEKDLDKIYKLGGIGGFYKKTDSTLIKDTFTRHEVELAEAIAADTTGEEFIYEMFLYELDNHEYGYTRDTEDTLDALGYTAEQVIGDPRLKRGIEKAIAEICKREGD